MTLIFNCTYQLVKKNKKGMNPEYSCPHKTVKRKVLFKIWNKY